LQAEQLCKVARHWLNAASDTKVCARLQTEGLPITLYNYIKEANPKESGRILKDFNPGLLKAVIELLLKVAAGHAESEEQLSLAIFEDIQLLAKIRDRAFINQLLLPLIENEVTVPVSFLDLESMTSSLQEQASADVDATEEEKIWQPDFDSLSCGNEQKEKKEVVDYSKNFLPSSLLDAEQKQAIFKGYKEILGAQSKNLMQKTLNSKWTCIHSTTEKMGSPS
jgi:hypothetical protein